MEVRLPTARKAKLQRQATAPGRMTGYCLKDQSHPLPSQRSFLSPAQTQSPYKGREGKAFILFNSVQLPFYLLAYSV